MTLPAPVSVRIVDKQGGAVSLAGVSVSASIIGGGGDIEGTLVRATDAVGVATFDDLVLTGLVGSRTVAFSAPGFDFASLLVQLMPGMPEALVAVAPTSQSGVAGSAASAPPEVRVVDGAGNGVPGVAVAFSVTEGGGRVTISSTSSDASGLASAGTWYLDYAAGNNEVTATSDALPSVVIFSALGNPGPAAQLVLREPIPVIEFTDGVPLEQPVFIGVADQYGNAVAQAGMSIAASIGSSGATVTGGSIAITNASGVAAFEGLTVEGAPGSYSLLFSSGSLTLSLTPVQVNSP